jgi:hypothetical protein
MGKLKPSRRPRGILDSVRFVGPLSLRQLHEAPVRSFWLFGATKEQADEMRASVARQVADELARKRIEESWLAIEDGLAEGLANG